MDANQTQAQASAAEVLLQLADFCEAAQRHYDAVDGPDIPGGRFQFEHDYGCKRDALEDLDPAALRLLAQPPAPAPAEALWLGDKDGLSAAGLAHALTLLPNKRRAQEAEVFCNGEPVTGVSILGEHGQSMGEFQVYILTEGQQRHATDIQIYPPALAEAGREEAKRHSE